MAEEPQLIDILNSPKVEIQIDSWLGLKDRRVVGEVTTETPEEAVVEEGATGFVPEGETSEPQKHR